MSHEELTGRTARAAAALQRWTEGRMAPDIVPALVAELRIVAGALEAEAEPMMQRVLRREVA